MFALLAARDADRWFTAVASDRSWLELPEPVQLGESEVGVDETVRG